MPVAVGEGLRLPSVVAPGAWRFYAAPVGSLQTLFLVVFVVGAGALTGAAVVLLARAQRGGPVRLRGREVAQPRLQAGSMICFAVFAAAGAVDILVPDSRLAQAGTLGVRLVALAVGIVLMTRVRRPERS